jgi:hypothetical protein
VQSIESEDDDKHCTAVANNVEEARKLLETGFEYVCSHKETMLFRKRKQESARASTRIRLIKRLRYRCIYEQGDWRDRWFCA